MAILNITYQGRSADVPERVDDDVADADVVRVALEVVRGGGLGDVAGRDLPDDAFRYFVVDRLADPSGGVRIYLRPKVPFGC